MQVQAFIQSLRNRWNQDSFTQIRSAAPFVALALGGMLVMRVTSSDHKNLSDRMLAPMAIHVVVGHGDSLWTLAKQYGSPSADVREEVNALAEANGMNSSEPLQPGQRLLVPVTNTQILAHLQPAVASIR